MSIIGVHSRVITFLVAAVLLLHVSPTLAAGQPDAQQVPLQSSRPIEVTFTKWLTFALPPGAPTRFLFKGIVGGDLGAGDFVAEVLDRRASTPCTSFVPPCTPGITPPTITGSIVGLQAIYEVQVGDHSFTALIRGGSNGVTGVGLLDGVILAGWRTGAPVHVEFQTITNCAEASGGTCFQGVIRVGRAPIE